MHIQLLEVKNQICKFARLLNVKNVIFKPYLLLIRSYTIFIEIV